MVTHQKYRKPIALVVAPNPLLAPPSAAGQTCEELGGVFVGILGVDGFARLELKAVAQHFDGLFDFAHQMHLHAACRRVKPRRVVEMVRA